VDLVEDVVHGILDRAGNRAVDRRGFRLVLGGTGIRGDATGRDRPTAQRPEKPFVPVILLFAAALDFGEGAGDALVGVVDVDIDRRTLFRLQPVFLVPDIQRCRLQWNFYRA